MAKRTGGLNKAKGLDALISGGRRSPFDLIDDPAIKKHPAEEKGPEETTIQKSEEKAPEKPEITAPEPVKAAQSAEIDENSVISVKISTVVPNKEQPRKQFGEEGLAELAESIKQYGVIVPLIVQKKGRYYEIIAGERRWRAAKLAGIKELPVIVREYTDSEAAEIALIENIQREDLNPIEEANAYSRLIDEFALTQEEVAKKVAKSRTAVTNSLRLLKLDERVQKLLIDEMLTMGHARALLAIENPEAQFDTANVIILRKMSVRETESYVKRLMKGPKIPEKPDTLQMDMVYQELEENLKSLLGTKTTIHRKKAGKGSIEIEFYSQEELERLVKMIRRIKQ